ncbi:hypothetical protein AB205_0108140 [Aquarana catesbeiana]|uniref:Uncharacterized protein n=1 Tax=Aquarana catesbeiana TaxID=8400 RepID=A0A2G9P0E1_AQUCT|nr:hypothetical protein AB205_0108140 [Aquarana catesbeiana]
MQRRVGQYKGPRSCTQKIASQALCGRSAVTWAVQIWSEEHCDCFWHNS